MQDLRRIIWIASYPKSGNTWTRVFLSNYFAPQGKSVDINRLHDFTTADVRVDFYDRAAGGKFQGETFDDWVMIRPKALKLIAQSRPGTHFVKTHCQIMRIAEYDLIPPNLTAAAIYIIRNPFDVAASYAKHMNKPMDETIDKLSDPKNNNYTGRLIFEILGRWDDHIASWLAPPGLARHVMRYEDMIANPEQAFRGLLGFLQVPVKDGQLRRSIRKSSFDSLRKAEEKAGFKEKPDAAEKFFRKGKADVWKEELTPAEVARIRQEFLPTIKKWYPEMLETTAAFAAKA